MPNAMTRDDLSQYGGDNNITFYYGSTGNPEKNFKGGYGIAHIGGKHGADTLLRVLNVIADGKIDRYVPGNKTVVLTDGEYEAVLALTRFGEKETWLFNGWKKDEKTGADGEVSTHSDATQANPTFSREDLGAVLSDAKVRNNMENDVKKDENLSEYVDFHKVSDADELAPEMKESVMQGQPMFFRTPDGHAYGFTYKGKIYIDPRIATSETPIHEYGHLWAEMKRQSAPEEWNSIKQALLGDKLIEPTIEKVRREYPELTGEGKEDDFVEEVLTQFSGKHGAEKLRKMAQEIKAELGDDATAATIAEAAVRRVKSVLNEFWKGVCDLMGWQYTNAEDVADAVLRDMLNGVNPRERMKEASEQILAYDEKMTPEQETLLRGHNFREYPSIQELSGSKDTKNSDTFQGNEGKSSGEGSKFQRVSSPEPFKLSDSKKDAEGNSFYERKGSVDLWSASSLFAKAGRQVAPIRLTDRNASHIMESHGNVFKSEQDVFDFLDGVFGNATKLRKGRGRGMFVVVENDKTDQAAIIKLMPSETGDYYNVETAGYYRKRKWKDSEEVIADLSELGQSDAAADASKPQVPDENGGELINTEAQTSSSDGKDTKNSDTFQGNEGKSSGEGQENENNSLKFQRVSPDSELTPENEQYWKQWDDKSVLMLGSPSQVLLSTGIKNKPMKLYGTKLIAKAKKHGYEPADIKNLPSAVASPLAVFTGSHPGTFDILTVLKIKGNNVLVSISPSNDVNDVDFNIISSVYDKKANSVLRWINEGKGLYYNKEKALTYLRHSTPIVETTDKQELDSAAKIVNSIDNPKLSDEKIHEIYPVVIC